MTDIATAAGIWASQHEAEAECIRDGFEDGDESVVEHEAALFAFVSADMLAPRGLTDDERADAVDAVCEWLHDYRATLRSARPAGTDEYNCGEFWT